MTCLNQPFKKYLTFKYIRAPPPTPRRKYLRFTLDRAARSETESNTFWYNKHDFHSLIKESALLQQHILPGKVEK